MGKFPPSRLAHYTALYDADEEGTRQLVDSLAEGVVPVHERGASPSSDTNDSQTHGAIMAGVFGVSSPASVNGKGS